MKTKKSKKANLENKRIIFLQIGVIVTLAAIIYAFEWAPVEIETKPFGPLNVQYEPLPDPIVIRDQPKIEKPKPKPVAILDIKPYDTKEDIPDLMVETIANQNDSVPVYEIPLKDPEEDPDIPQMIGMVQHKPEYPGGEEAMRRFIANNIKYPRSLADIGISGTVYVKFIINRKGQVADIEIVRGLHPALDQEVERVMSLMPDWTPGRQGHKTVSVIYSLPVRFNKTY